MYFEPYPSTALYTDTAKRPLIVEGIQPCSTDRAYLWQRGPSPRAAVLVRARRPTFPRICYCFYLSVSWKSQTPLPLPMTPPVRNVSYFLLRVVNRAVFPEARAPSSLIICGRCQLRGSLKWHSSSLPHCSPNLRYEYLHMACAEQIFRIPCPTLNRK